MSTLQERPHTALVVIDVQNDVMAGTHNRDGVVANIAQLIGRARSHAVPIIWIQHSADDLPAGSDGWQYVAELTPDEQDPVVPKRYPDAFEDSDLETVLARRGIGRLIVAGAQTDECIRSTLHGAIVRGYDAILVSDAHTTEDLTEWGAPPPAKVIDHTNLYWDNHTAPGRTAGIVPTAAVDFGETRSQRSQRSRAQT